jgi:hypothetical protein
VGYIFIPKLLAVGFGRSAKLVADGSTVDDASSMLHSIRKIVCSP